ncbi:MAG: hypothetical protein KC479_10480 [Dehalococcoidia bacterium]|nr:hypothetical protein [Dehalococcoidia bacterium]
MTRSITTVGTLAVVLGALMLAMMFSAPRAHAQTPVPESTVIVDCYGIQGLDAQGHPIWGFIPCEQLEEGPCFAQAGVDAQGQPVYREVPCDNEPDCDVLTHFDPDCYDDDPGCLQVPGTAAVPFDPRCCDELFGQIPFEKWEILCDRPDCDDPQSFPSIDAWLEECYDCEDLVFDNDPNQDLVERLCDEPDCEDIGSYPSPKAWVEDCFDCDDLENLPTPSLLDFIDEEECDEPNCEDFNSYPSPQAWIDDCFECEDLHNLPTPSLLDLIDLEECDDDEPNCDDLLSYDTFDQWLEECNEFDCENPSTFPDQETYLEECDEPDCEELQRDCDDDEPGCEELRDDCDDDEPDCEDRGDCLVIETPVPEVTPAPPAAGMGQSLTTMNGNAVWLAVLLVAGGGLLGGAALGLGRNR